MGSSRGNSIIHTVLWLERNSVFPKVEHEQSEKKMVEKGSLWYNLSNSQLGKCERTVGSKGVKQETFQKVQLVGNHLNCYLNLAVKETRALQRVNIFFPMFFSLHRYLNKILKLFLPVVGHVASGIAHSPTSEIFSIFAKHFEGIEQRAVWQ